MQRHHYFGRAMAIAGALVASLCLHGAPAQSQPNPVSPFPGGASSVSETYKDWSVSCVMQEAGKRCALTQTQTQQGGQRVLAIELSAPNGNKLTGVLVLPFGLALDSGATLQIDDKPAGQPLRFRTCLPAGCLIPLDFDGAMITALRAGTALKIKMHADGGKETALSISLQGFPAALDRTTALAR
jgi:invasion protein IalB